MRYVCNDCYSVFEEPTFQRYGRMEAYADVSYCPHCNSEDYEEATPAVLTTLIRKSHENSLHWAKKENFQFHKDMEDKFYELMTELEEII